MFNAFKLHRAPHDNRFFVYKIENDSEIVVDTFGDKTKNYDDFTECLPPTECRYGVYDLDFTTVDGRNANKLVFISWSPDVAKIKNKMVYAASKVIRVCRLLSFRVVPCTWRNIIATINSVGKGMTRFFCKASVTPPLAVCSSLFLVTSCLRACFCIYQVYLLLGPCVGNCCNAVAVYCEVCIMSTVMRIIDGRAIIFKTLFRMPTIFVRRCVAPSSVSLFSGVPAVCLICATGGHQVGTYGHRNTPSGNGPRGARA